jgi:hypothetical protein
MVKTFADALMSAEADTLCGASYGERSEERTNSRNRPRDWDTRVGTVELAIPKLRTGSYVPDWLLQHRRRAEQALVSVVAATTTMTVIRADCPFPPSWASHRRHRPAVASRPYRSTTPSVALAQLPGVAHLHR